ncbi:MAG: LysR family transcriptional regulator [Rhodospirillales bacterium]|nr:LysR family transcriptional regulator [Rhodospirillales bacterium]
MPWTERTKRRLKLRDLDVLASVVETGSMGRAAKKLGISQPAVSKSVVELEDALGVRLLDRSRRGIVPTPYGVALHRKGAAVFNELRQAVQHIDFLADPTRGEVRIGSTAPVAISLMSPVVDALSREHPKMLFHVVTAGTGALYSAVADRRVDFAVCRMIDRLPGELDAEVLFHDAFAVMTSADNPLTRRRKLRWADLADEPWTLYPMDSLFGSIVAHAFRVSGFEPPRACVVSESFDLQRELLATGRFLTVLPSFMLKLPHKGLSLRALPVSLTNSRMPVGLITLKDRSLTPPAQLFIDRLRAHARPLSAA